MYAQIERFGIAKETNAIVEEGIAPVYVRRFYELQGRRVLKVTKNMGDLAQSRKYDLIDSLGVK